MRTKMLNIRLTDIITSFDLIMSEWLFIDTLILSFKVLS